MNALVDKFGDKIAVLGVPSNQFGHQTNEGDDEFVNTLKHVRPGNGDSVDYWICAVDSNGEQTPLESAGEPRGGVGEGIVYGRIGIGCV